MLRPEVQCWEHLQADANLTISLSTTSTLYAESYYNGCSSTTRNGVTIIVSPLPVPYSLTASPASICNGIASSLSATVIEGLIRWWTASTGGTLLGSSPGGAFFNVNPSISTTYYAEAYSNCTSPLRASVTVTVSAAVLPPAFARTDTTNICSNYSGNINLSASGGTGTSTWWYTSGCGTIFIGAGNPLSIAPPLITTTYWANSLFSGCTNSICVSVTVSIIPYPVQPQSLNTSLNNLCSNAGGNITLTASGGTGTILTWFISGCGLTVAGTGISRVIPSPVVTADYYARWQVSGCGYSNCSTIEITVIPLPVAPVSDSTNNNNFCANAGGNISLSVSGGAGSWVGWYGNSCGGISFGTGNPLSITAPSVSTEYFVRWENICGTSTCKTIIINVLPLDIAPVSVSSDLNNYCSNYVGNIHLSASGGSGTTFSWFNGSCGGNPSGTGIVAAITAPSVTSTYFGRWQNTCGNSTCKSIIIIVNSLPSAPLSAATDRNYFCPGAGGNISLSVSGGFGSTAGWYLDGCGITQVGTGNPLVISAPSINTIYWANMQTPACANSTCVSVTIVIVRVFITSYHSIIRY